jgi:GT2 family glycosyltransferase/glycosyltransferase involved in cell wall biosynthesis
MLFTVCEKLPMSASWLLLSKYPRRARLVLWWVVTFQLRRQYRWWRHVRLHGPAPPAAVAGLDLELGPIDLGSVRFQADPMPDVSIIIPTYGQVDFTLRCLAAIARNRPVCSIEILVIDDASPDPEVEILAAIPGIRLIRQTTNLGYLHSTNAAAAVARGKFLLLLNNDTQVQPGWLDPMLALFHAAPAVGAVGSKLIYPDGRLQEAGGIIWADGSGWNVGRFDPPDLPVHDYVREVDYCSAACLLVRRSVFLDIGGFDPRYAPAYYEDTDLAFRLRERGLLVLYQPRSRVVHFEGVSHGTNIDAGGKAHQAINRLRFVESWCRVLTQQHFPNGKNVLRARERGKPVVLVFDHYVPEPDRDAGSRNILSLILALRQSGYAIKFAPHAARPNPAYADALAQLGVEILPRLALGGRADSHSDFLACHGGELDFVLLSRPDVARHYLPALRQHTRAKIVYYGHDLHFARLARQADRLDCALSRRQSALMERQERQIWRSVDLVLYPSAEEAEAALRLEPAAVLRAVIPFSFASFPPPRRPVATRDILFVAGFGHPPNEDAAVWLARDIFPVIRAALPQARLRIVGSNPTARVLALAGPGIVLAANVTAEELAGEYATARVAVVPLRFGAGVKLKVVEALQAGLPLVTTTTGAQGLPGLAAIAAVDDTAGGIAKAICRLLTDDEQWREAAAAQVAYAREKFSEAAVRDALLEALAVLNPQLAVAAE